MCHPSWGHARTAAQRLNDLKRLRRDRFDREYAQPLNVETLARGVNISAGHLGRQFRPAYGESPYGYAYLMTHRIERAKPLLRRGDLNVTDVCFGRLLVSGHLRHPLHRADRHATQHLPPASNEHRGRDTTMRGRTSDKTGQEPTSTDRRATTGSTTTASTNPVTLHSDGLTTDQSPGRARSARFPGRVPAEQHVPPPAAEPVGCRAHRLATSRWQPTGRGPAHHPVHRYARPRT